MQDKTLSTPIHLIKAIRLVYNSSPKWTYINTFLTILRGLIPLLLLIVVRQLIDAIDGSVQHSSFQNNNIYYSLALVATFFILNALSSSFNVLARERQSHYLNDYIQDLIHNKTVNLPYGYFEDSKYQDLFYRAVNEANFRPGNVFYGLLGFFQNAITLIVLLSVLVSFHWAMIPALIIAGIPIVAFRLYYSRKRYKIKNEQTEDERRLHYFNRLLVGKDFAKEVRVFNLSKTFTDKYNSVKDLLRSRQWALSIKKTYWEASVQIFATLILIMIFYLMIGKALTGEISKGTIAMYFLALQRSYSVLQELLTRMSSLLEDNLFLKNFFEFDKIDIPSKKTTEGNFPMPLTKGIHCENISFKYPNTNRSVLNNFSLTIPAGKTVAIVGANGSGKTTLVKLLTGLYTPSSGAIKFDNTNLNTIHPKDLADNISVIFQDFMLYNVSAKDNIKYGNVRRPDTQEAITDAAQRAGIHDIFSNLKEGYNTPLGTLFKDSEMLSRGEWQRTALARSFYNEAQLIILDEPTSSLDAYTEAKLLSHFKAITSNRTAIIISHRLSTIHLADLIVVLKDGKITEQGTYKELLHTKGEFSNMVNSLNLSS